MVSIIDSDFRKLSKAMSSIFRNGTVKCDTTLKKKWEHGVRLGLNNCEGTDNDENTQLVGAYLQSVI